MSAQERAGQVPATAGRPARFHIVTGKGGTGKTTVAAALALALASEGRRTLLVEVEGRQGIAQLFEAEPLPYEERKIAVVPGSGAAARSASVEGGGGRRENSAAARSASVEGGGGRRGNSAAARSASVEGGGGRRAGEVYALAIDPELALLDYLDMFYKLGRAGRALKKIGAIDFATTIAPGLRDVLLTGKACEAVRRKDKAGWRTYDAVVMDAPPTGRITRFLNVNDEVAGLARFGPIYNQAQAVMRVLKSSETAVHLVTLLEEMPVQETVDGAAELRAAGLPVGAVLINMLRPVVLDDVAVASANNGNRRAAIARALSQAGLGGARRGGNAERLVDPLLEQAREHTERVVIERQERAEIASLALPTYELELLDDGVDVSGLYKLAESLRKQGFGELR